MVAKRPLRSRRELPEVIVPDPLMPVVSGFDVVEGLKEEAATAHIPILVVTGKSLTADERVKLGSHAAAIVEKSYFDCNRFATKVRRAMVDRRRNA